MHGFTLWDYLLCILPNSILDDNDQHSTNDTLQKKIRNRKLSKKRKIVERLIIIDINVKV